MAMHKCFINKNVYEEAKERIKKILNLFDTIAICFSGGKDSLAVLHLTKEVYKDLRINQKIKVIFRDEELIPDDVINFVQKYYYSQEYGFYYFAIPLKSHKFILGITSEYIQWDKNRQWIRQKPEFAITLDKNDNRIFDQYTSDTYIAQRFKGKIAFLTGIRADESIIRHNACFMKKNLNYITKTNDTRVKLCKPIFDWSQKDIFKYFYDNKIAYCPIYDNQLLNQDNLRVSTPLHAESSKRFHKLKSLYPIFYQQIVDIFPEMMAHERYWLQIDRYKIINHYDKSWKGIKDYINEIIIDQEERKLALKRVNECRKTRINKGRKSINYGGYPLLYVFKQIVNGNFKRAIQPKKDPTQKEIEYENQTVCV